MLFVWNGKEADRVVKAEALTKGYALDSVLNSGGDTMLSFMFNGGVVKGAKLQKGKVLVFTEALSS